MNKLIATLTVAAALAVPAAASADAPSNPNETNCVGVLLSAAVPGEQPGEIGGFISEEAPNGTIPDRIAEAREEGCIFG